MANKRYITYKKTYIITPILCKSHKIGALFLALQSQLILKSILIVRNFYYIMNIGFKELIPDIKSGGKQKWRIFYRDKSETCVF